ncbi:unnamed protein product, partial [Chrysoparadoxa australica]
WLWCDLETTGLDPSAPNFGILEIAAVVTDCDLNVKDSLHLIVHQSDEVIAGSSNWCKERFCRQLEGGNDLFPQCQLSAISEEMAGIHLRDFIGRHVVSRAPEENPRRKLLQQAQFPSSEADPSRERHRFYRVLLAGTSVYFDRGVLLDKYPYLRDYIGHKVIDVTSILEATRRWRPDVSRTIGVPSGVHRALPDVLETLKLGKLLWRTCFVPG